MKTHDVLILTKQNVLVPSSLNPLFNNDSNDTLEGVIYYLY